MLKSLTAGPVLGTGAAFVSQSGRLGIKCPVQTHSTSRGRKTIQTRAKYEVADDVPLFKPEDLGISPDMFKTPQPQPSKPADLSTEAPSNLEPPPTDKLPPSSTTIDSPKMSAVPEVPASPSQMSVESSSSATPGPVSPEVVTSAPPSSDEAAGIEVPALPDASEKVGELQESLNQSASSFTDSATEATSQLTSGISSATDDITQAFQDTTESIQGSASAAFAGVSEEAGVFTKSAQDEVQAFLDSAGSAAAAFSDVVNKEIGVVTGVTQDIQTTVTSTAISTLQGVESSVGATRDQIWSSIPPEAQGALIQVAGTVGAAAATVSSHPSESLAVVGVIALPSLYLGYSSRYGGFAGELGPQEVSELLLSDTDALLVDIRADPVREREGIAELKLSARFKAIALDERFAQAQIALASPAVLRQVDRKEELVRALHAAFIANLKQVKTPLCKVVLMDSEGGDGARGLARALRREGIFQSYIMQGGFNKWKASGLDVVTGPLEYDASPVRYLGDNLEVVTKQAVSYVQQLRDPSVGVPVAATAVVASVAAFNYHTTLQVFGLWGLSWTVFNEIKNYGSPQAALEAYSQKIQALTGGGASAAQPVLSAASETVSAAEEARQQLPRRSDEQPQAVEYAAAAEEAAEPTSPPLSYPLPAGVPQANPGPDQSASAAAAPQAQSKAGGGDAGSA